MQHVLKRKWTNGLNVMRGLVCFMCRWRQTRPIYATVFTTFSMGCVNFATLMPTPSSARSGILHRVIFAHMAFIVQFFPWSVSVETDPLGSISICVLKVCDAQSQYALLLNHVKLRHKHALLLSHVKLRHKHALLLGHVMLRDCSWVMHCFRVAPSCLLQPASRGILRALN